MKNEKSVKSQVFKSETKLIAYVVICLVIIVIGSSYALFFSVGKSSKNMVIQVGNLSFAYSNANTKIAKVANNVICLQPKTLEEAMALPDCGYNFSVTNTGSLSSNYQLKLITNSNNTIESNKMKVIVRKQVGDAFQVLQGFPKEVSSLPNGIMHSDAITTGATAVYNVQVYLDSDLAKPTDNGKVISYSVQGIGEVLES